MAEQDEWAGHADFMDELADEGTVVLGGPLSGGTHVLLICQGPDEETVRARLAQDPWARLGLLEVASVERWEVLLGRFSLV